MLDPFYAIVKPSSTRLQLAYLQCMVASLASSCPPTHIHLHIYSLATGRLCVHIYRAIGCYLLYILSSDNNTTGLAYNFCNFYATATLFSWCWPLLPQQRSLRPALSALSQSVIELWHSLSSVIFQISFSTEFPCKGL